MAGKNHEETNIQKEIMLELSKYGVPIRQQSGNFLTEYGGRVQVGITGISDILFCKNNGKIAWLEVKTKKGKPSDEQKNFIEVMQSMGFCAGIVRSVEDAINLIKDL